MKKLEAGGEEAAELLRGSIRTYIQEHLPGIQVDMEPVVRVFANMRGLGKTLVDAQILDSSEDLGRFVCGFNKKFTSFDFIDAGNGKECSDSKLKSIFPSFIVRPWLTVPVRSENFELSVHNVHCRHIIFGGSADNGYARLLSSYTGDPSTSKMITMLEGPPFAHELIPIVEKLKQCSFSNVFRSTKIPPRRVSFSTTPPRSKSPAITSYASTAAAAKEESPIPITRSTSHQQASDTVQRNGKGHRVDPPIRVPQAVQLFIKNQRVCKNYHLLGMCAYHERDCAYTHTPLSSMQKDALRIFARQMPCESGLQCDDPSCYYGHRCFRDPCKSKTCKFPADMHNVDTKVVN